MGLRRVVLFTVVKSLGNLRAPLDAPHKLRRHACRARGLGHAHCARIGLVVHAMLWPQKPQL